MPFYSEAEIQEFQNFLLHLPCSHRLLAVLENMGMQIVLLYSQST